jgi:hypothetical protein
MVVADDPRGYGEEYDEKHRCSAVVDAVHHSGRGESVEWIRGDQRERQHAGYERTRPKERLVREKPEERREPGCVPGKEIRHRQRE